MFAIPVLNCFSLPACCTGSAREEKVEREEFQEVAPVSKPMTQQAIVKRAKSITPVARRVRAASTSGKNKNALKQS